jgi:hypothetical protein
MRKDGRGSRRMRKDRRGSRAGWVWLPTTMWECMTTGVEASC